MELARTVAMLFVLIFHADFLSLGWPSLEDSIDAPFTTIIRLLVEAVTVCCVNLFVMISGWFGIHPTVKKAFHLLEVTLFYSLSIFLIFIFVDGRQAITIDSVKNALLLSQGYWFIKCYLFLFILSPALNLIVDKLPKEKILALLTGLFVYQSVFGWSEATFDYHHGYSSLLFIFLYLLARCANKYDFAMKNNRKVWMAVYLSIVIFMVGLTYLATRLTWIPSSLVWYNFNYLNPLVILSAFALLLYFSNLHFISNAVNWISSSVLAVYLIHSNDVILPLYAGNVNYLYNGTNHPLITLSLFVACVFVACILIDKIRAFLFKIVHLE